MTLSKFEDDPKLRQAAERNFWNSHMNQKLTVYSLSHILVT